MVTLKLVDEPCLGPRAPDSQSSVPHSTRLMGQLC